MQLPGGVGRRVNVRSGEAQVERRAGRAPPRPPNLCVLVSGDGERGSNHLSFCKSPGLVQAAITSHVGVIINTQLSLSLSH